MAANDDGLRPPFHGDSTICEPDELPAVPEGAVEQRQALAINGLVMSLLFLALQAPDVAFSQLVVGTVAVPLMLLAALASMRMDRTPRGKRE